MGGSKYTLNIGPGNVIGAMSVGSGAAVEGSVAVGGPQSTVTPDGLVRCEVKIRRMSREDAAAHLRSLADKIEEGHSGSKTKGDVSGGVPGRAIVWTVEVDR